MLVTLALRRNRDPVPLKMTVDVDDMCLDADKLAFTANLFLFELGFRSVDAPVRGNASELGEVIDRDAAAFIRSTALSASRHHFELWRSLSGAGDRVAANGAFVAGIYAAVIGGYFTRHTASKPSPVRE